MMNTHFTKGIHVKRLFFSKHKTIATTWFSYVNFICFWQIVVLLNELFSRRSFLADNGSVFELVKDLKLTITLFSSIMPTQAE